MSEDLESNVEAMTPAAVAGRLLAIYGTDASTRAIEHADDFFNCGLPLIAIIFGKAAEIVERRLASAPPAIN